MGGLRSIISVFACALPLAVAAQEPDRIDRDPARVTVDVEELKAEIQKILDENRIPGASVALVEKERTLWAGGVGMADVDAGVDVTANHLFRVGSISKSFTALAVLHAVEDGLLNLDTPVRELAPEVGFTNRWERTHPITVAMVMEHTAGFDDIHFREYAKVDDPGITLADGLAYNPGSRVSRWQPGTHMSYSNSGPPIAAYIVEKITGKPFEDYVREHVFDPLGMESSTFHFPRDAALLAKGYEADGVREASYDHIIVRPSGGLNSSSREMARYLRMMINRGTLDGVRLLAPKTITRMETPTTTLAARAGFNLRVRTRQLHLDRERPPLSRPQRGHHRFRVDERVFLRTRRRLLRVDQQAEQRDPGHRHAPWQATDRRVREARGRGRGAVRR